MKMIKRRWTKKEDAILSSTLKDGVKLKVLIEKLPDRTEMAISRRATSFDFSTKTVDGEKVLFAGVKRRTRRTKLKISLDEKVGEDSATTNSTTPTTSESLLQTSDVILTDTSLKKTNIGLYANNLATKMLLEQELPVTPDMVCSLSEYIIEFYDDNRGD